MASLVVPLRRTSLGLSRAEWVRSRHLAAYRALRDLGLSPEQAWNVATALTAQWTRETGWGRAEYDFALGNIRWTPAWNGATHYLQGNDDASPAVYRAYPTLDAGVRDSVRLLALDRRYRPAFLRLVASNDAVRWYSEIMRAGYNPWSQHGVDEFASLVGPISRIVGNVIPAETPTAAKVFLGASIAVAAGLLGYVGVKAARGA
jgi:hypothetical protein